MKIFGWIHSKIRNSSSGLLKDSGTGNPCCLSLKPTSTWNNHQGPMNSSKRPQHEFEKYMSECDADRAQEGDFGEEIGETFPGFLTIGTLNVESTATEPATPTFGFAPDHETAEEMHYDMKLINDELEKFLKEEAGDSRRASIASTISLSGKVQERLDDDKEVNNFPLQGYLFASSYDLSASKEEYLEQQKTALMELFEISKEADKKSIIDAEEKQVQSIRKCKAMRRILKALQPFSKSTAALRDGASTESSPPRGKFHEIKQLFRRKIHPEGFTDVKEGKNRRPATNRKPCGEAWPDHQLGKHSYNNKVRISQNATTEATCTPPLQESTANGTNAEHWINTDADYLVLELGQN